MKKTGYAKFVANNTLRIIKNGFNALGVITKHMFNAFLHLFVLTLNTLWNCGFLTEIKPKNQLLNLYKILKIHYFHAFVYNFRYWILCLKFFPYYNLYDFITIIIDVDCKNKKLRSIILISNIMISVI